MEPGSDQYVCSGNNQLYFYADYRRSMCCFLNAKCYDLHAGYANFQWDLTTLSELCSTCFASNFKRRNQRNLEPGSDQYIDSRSIQLYIYSDYRRSMRCSLNAKCYDLHAGCANFQWDRTILSKHNGACTSGHIEGRDQRHLESCCYQHGDCRNNQLYLYTNHRRSLRCSRHAKCYDHCTGCTNLQWDRTTLSELGSSCFASNFQRRNQRNMEPGDNKYCNYWNNQLYFYADHRQCMCCSNHGGHYDHQAGYTNLQWDRTAVSELYSSCFACNFQGRNQRNLEPVDNKYRNYWNNQLYIYSNHQRSMCCSLNTRCYDHCTGCTNFQWDRTTLSKRNGTCTSCHIEGRDQRNLEPGGDQYIDSRNNQLYIYSNYRRCMFCSRHAKCYDQCTGCTNFQWDRTTVSELCCACFTCNFQRRDQRNLEPGGDQYIDSRNNQLYFYSDHRQCMFCSSHREHYDLQAGCTYLQWDRTTVSELHSSCFACNFQRRNQRHLEPGDNKYCNYWNNQLYFYADQQRYMFCSGHAKCYDLNRGYTNF